MTPDQFPHMRASLAEHAHFDIALHQISEGLKAGSIRSVVWADAKQTLSRFASAAWEVQVREQFFRSGKWERQPRAVQDLEDSIQIMGLHDVLSTAKKVGRSTASGPAVDAMKSYCAEVLPLALAVASLKDMIVKGRAPSAVPPKPENPNKIVRTCPVCFRKIAATSGKMAHHGYQRPGGGWQTSSCPGIRFKPLEVSPDGLRWLVGTLREQLVVARRAYDLRDTLPEEFLVRDYSAKSASAMKKIGRSDPGWDGEFRRHVQELESEISLLQTELPQLEHRLTNWVVTEQQYLQSAHA
ncbi:hypothetical protein [Acidovorax sp.]|uniref:hypothetical protein n=1 Tax=Acidovorax sp. TaxID=1872122 RepID=UPI00391F007F